MAWLIICFNIFVPAGIILAHVVCRSKQQDQGSDDVNDVERAQLNHIFCILDADGSGALSVDEVATFVHVTSTPLIGDTAARAEALAMLRSADLDDDGTLSEAEWNTSRMLNTGGP